MWKRNKSKNIIVKNTEHLRQLIKEENHDYALNLAGGACFSRKSIYLSDKKNKDFNIYNSIDESEIDLTDKELDTQSNIGEGIKKNSFICIKD